MFKWMLAVVAFCGVIAASCVTTPGGTPPTPDHPLWACGDSVAFEMAVAMASKPYTCGGGGTGFNDYAPLGKTVDFVIDQLDDGGPWTPELMIVMGGTNGAVHTTVADQINGMLEFETAVQSRGIPVRWVANPAQGWAHLIDPLSDWLLANRPDTIDCRGQAVGFRDGVHMTKTANQWFANCVNDALPEHLQVRPPIEP